MSRFVPFALCAALAFMGCANTPVSPAPVTPDAAKALPQSAPVEPADSPNAEAAPAPQKDAPKHIGSTLPTGWTSVPRDNLPEELLGVLQQKSLKAQILIQVFKSGGQTATEQVASFCAGAPADIKMSAPVTSKDGNTAYADIDAGAIHGRFTVKHLADGVVVVLVGRWPSENDKAVVPDVEKIVSSTDYR